MKNLLLIPVMAFVLSVAGCFPGYVSHTKIVKEERLARAHATRLVNVVPATEAEAKANAEALKFWEGYITALDVIRKK